MANFSSRLSPLTVSVPAASDWQAYTPSLKGQTSDPTVTAINGQWRRNGANIEVQVAATMTAYGSGDLYFTLPSGLAIDYTKMSNIVNDYGIGAGNGYVSTNAGATRIEIQPGFIQTSPYTNGVKMYKYNSASLSASDFTGASSVVFLVFTAPISGWSSHTSSAATADAVTTTGTQTISGAKTFSGGASIVGKTNGVAVSAGYVGEVLEASRTSNISGSTTAGTLTDITSASISLTSGCWEIEVIGRLYMENNNGTGSNGRLAVIMIRDGSNNEIVRNSTGHCNSQKTIERVIAYVKTRVNITSTTTYKASFTSIENVSSTTLGSLIAEASASYPFTIRAVRIA